jgi:hypothetical protein
MEIWPHRTMTRNCYTQGVLFAGKALKIKEKINMAERETADSLFYTLQYRPHII